VRYRFLYIGGTNASYVWNLEDDAPAPLHSDGTINCISATVRLSLASLALSLIIVIIQRPHPGLLPLPMAPYGDTKLDRLFRRRRYSPVLEASKSMVSLQSQAESDWPLLQGESSIDCNRPTLMIRYRDNMTHLLSLPDNELIGVLEGHERGVRRVSWHPFQPRLVRCAT